MCHIAICRIFDLQGAKQKAIAEVNKAMELCKTDRVTANANEMLRMIRGNYNIPANTNYVSLEPHWITLEAQHIIYHFEDTSGPQNWIKQYIDLHEAAYDTINKTFQAFPPRKPEFFIWKNSGLARQLLGHDLGFTNPRKCISHVTANQTIGHELTHILSYWGWGQPTYKEVPFITEGVAVAFSLAQKDKYPLGKEKFMERKKKDPAFSV